MSAGGWILLALVVVPLGAYLAVRLGSAAYFKSKQQHDSFTRKDDHG